MLNVTKEKRLANNIKINDCFNFCEEMFSDSIPAYGYEYTCQRVCLVGVVNGEIPSDEEIASIANGSYDYTSIIEELEKHVRRDAEYWESIAKEMNITLQQEIIESLTLNADEQARLFEDNEIKKSLSEILEERANYIENEM